jgi:hypothetical protein
MEGSGASWLLGHEHACGSMRPSTSATGRFGKRLASEACWRRRPEVLAAEPLPIDGGSWPVFELTQAVQRVLDLPEQVEEGLR